MAETGSLLHDVFLPFPAEELLEHFVDTGRRSDDPLHHLTAWRARIAAADLRRESDPAFLDRDETLWTNEPNSSRPFRRYLETAGAVLPNALVVALDPRARFEPLDEASQMGHLIVPVAESKDDGKKAAWIIDGQHIAAIREADVEQFPVYVTASITTVSEQRS